MFAFLFSGFIIAFSEKRINCDFLKNGGGSLHVFTINGRFFLDYLSIGRSYYRQRYKIFYKEDFSMKQILSMVLALTLAAGLTACGNSVSEMVNDAENQVAEYRGNVSTTTDGRVNGTNEPERQDRTGRTPVRPMPKSENTDSMGAGMRK